MQAGKVRGKVIWKEDGMNKEYLAKLFGLEDKVAVVTGGGGVLCGCMCRALAQAGSRVVVLDLLEPAAKKVADEITASGGQGIPFQADALDKGSLDKVCAKVLEKFGRVDILINGAGGNKAQATTSPDFSFFDLPQDAFQWVFNLNFTCTLLASQVFGKTMARQGEGVILNISSMNYFRPLTRVPAYSAAKAAVIQLTKVTALEYARKNIRVNCILPGPIDTPFFTKVSGADPAKIAIFKEMVRNEVPLGRFAQPEEIARVALFLASDEASYITGAAFAADGGQLLV